MRVVLFSFSTQANICLYADCLYANATRLFNLAFSWQILRFAISQVINSLVTIKNRSLSKYFDATMRSLLFLQLLRSLSLLMLPCGFHQWTQSLGLLSVWPIHDYFLFIICCVRDACPVIFHRLTLLTVEDQ